jgi:hypothetical protein
VSAPTAPSRQHEPSTVAAVNCSPSRVTASTVAETGSMRATTDTVAARSTAAPAKYRP